MLTGNESYIKRLQDGETIVFKSKGNSMTPKIKSGQACKYKPVTKDDDVKEGDMVFCKVNGRIFTHLVTAKKQKGLIWRYQISNNHGHVNGWAEIDKIYGKVIEVL